MVAPPLDRMWSRGRLSFGERVQRLASKRWHLLQCAVAAGLAYFVAADLLGHDRPFIAPVAAVLCLGTSYGQRLRRVAEVCVGVAVGVLVADLVVLQIGAGTWQLVLIVGLSMSIALLLDAGQLLVTQAAVQSIVITTLVPAADVALLRWTDALVGGGVALVAAAVAPATPLLRPRANAALVARKIAELLRAVANVIEQGEIDRALDVLADARGTDRLVRELQAAADEGLAVVASSPFRVRHRDDLRRMAELVDPLDRALRSTRVLVRHATVAAYHHRPVPRSYALLARDLGDAVDEVADELQANRMAVEARSPLLAVGDATGRVERTEVLAAEAVLAQLRAIVVDLLMVTGLDQLESSDALPPPPR